MDQLPKVVLCHVTTVWVCSVIGILNGLMSDEKDNQHVNYF